jgi:calcium-dependent protein kinase
MFKQKRSGDIDIKIIDFGLSNYMESKIHASAVGTPFYVAPEVLKHNYSLKCDIWSLGVIMYILLSGYLPFPGKSQNEVINNIQKCKLNFTMEEWKNVSPEAVNFISKCLIKNPSKRYSA